MATVVPSITRRGDAPNQDFIANFPAMVLNDSGQWVSIPGHKLLSFSVTGTFGTGGAVTITESNVDATLAGVTGAQVDETVIAVVSSAGINVVPTGIAASYRARVDVGDGTTTLAVKFYFGR